jgi:hypothetical protein
MSAETIKRKAAWLPFYGLLTVGFYFSLIHWPLITGSIGMLFLSASTLLVCFKSADEAKRARARLRGCNERVNERIRSILPDDKISNSKP